MAISVNQHGTCERDVLYKRIESKGLISDLIQSGIFHCVLVVNCIKDLKFY